MILYAKQDNKNATLDIINKFMPLIKKYSRKLYYDEADSDLIIALIKVIKPYPIDNKNSEEYEIVSYISKSIYHEYIKLSKKNYKISTLEIPLDDDVYSIQSYGTNNDFEDLMFVYEMLDKLPVNQRNLLEDLFINGYSETSLAMRNNVSRQYINKLKRKALLNLKEYMVNNVDC